MNAAAYRLFGGYRFVLAMMVVIQHLQHLLPPEDRGFFNRMGLGEVAVAVFFVISGFIVAEANSQFYAGRPGAFLFNRVLRIVPPFLAALAVSVLVHGLLWQAGRLVLWDFTLTETPVRQDVVLANTISFLPGFRHVFGRFEFIPFVWSLRVEMSFYVVACLAYAATSLAARHISGWTRQMAEAAAAIFFAGGIGLFLLHFIAGPESMAHTPYFMFGMAVYFLLAIGGRRHLGLTLLMAVMAIVAFYGWPGRQIALGRDPVAQTILFAVFAVVTWGLSSITRPAERWVRIDKVLGDLSYSIYLNHYVVGIIIYNFWPQGPLTYAAGIILSLPVAWVMQVLTERPLRRFRDFIRGRTLETA